VPVTATAAAATIGRMKNAVAMMVQRAAARGRITGGTGSPSTRRLALLAAEAETIRPSRPSKENFA